MKGNSTENGEHKTCLPVNNVGILGFELYFPKNFVCQKDLEKFDEVSAGKYTIGLGQSEMSFCSDNEDVCSLALSATAALLYNYKIDPKTIGFVEVGSETLIDKSKSVKTVLMDLFGQNSDIQGADVKNACFGGTQAMLHAVDWVYSNYDTEERLAIIVCVDIAIYAPGAARCTGGAGAVALLIGPNAPLVLEKGLRGAFSKNSYDFYKPVGGTSSEYPTVNGHSSVELYLTALDQTYKRYNEKCKKITGKTRPITDFCALHFHSPFAKLAQKGFARLAFSNFKDGHDLSSEMEANKLESYKAVNLSETFNGDFTTAIMKASQPLMMKKLNCNLDFTRRLGNMYTPSLYLQLINFICNQSNSKEMDQKKSLLFSYGSGCIAVMYSIEFHTQTKQLQQQYAQMFDSAHRACQRLDARIKHTPQQFQQVLGRREQLIATKRAYIPAVGDVTTNFFPGSYYLASIDENCCRSYYKTPY